MFETRYLDTTHGRLCYLQTTPALDQKLVFFHGGFGHPRSIDSLDQLFRPYGYQIVAPYLPGHGKSFSPHGQFVYQDLVNTMIEFVEKTHLQKSVAIGHSLGGRVVIDLHQEFTKVVAISPVLVPIRYPFLRTWALLAKDYLKDSGIVENRLLSDLVRNVLNVPSIWHTVQSIPEIDLHEAISNVLICVGKNDSLLTFPSTLATTLEFQSGHYLFLGKTKQVVLKEILGFISVKIN